MYCILRSLVFNGHVCAQNAKDLGPLVQKVQDRDPYVCQRVFLPISQARYHSNGE